MISIITITYNDFEGLKKTLSSIPEYDFIESVVINGGTDKSSFEYLKTHSGKVINEKDEGISDAFNKGIKMSAGNSIMFLNSGDELIDPEYLRKAKDIFVSNFGVDFIHSNLILIDPVGTKLFMKPAFCSLGRGLPYLHPTMIVRKSVFSETGLFNKEYKIAMDFDFVVRLVNKNYKGFYLSDMFVVKMDGTGRSIDKEFEAIIECFNSLKQNHFLNLASLFGITVRIILYSLRKTMVAIGLEGLLRKLKKQKHSAPVNL